MPGAAQPADSQQLASVEPCAGEAQVAELRVAALAIAAGPPFQRIRSVAAEAARADLRVAPTAHTAAITESIKIAREAIRAKFLVSPLANSTSGRVPQVGDNVLPKTSEATRSNFRVTSTAFAATFIELIQITRET